MGLQKITFEGSNITSKMDSDIYHFLFSKYVGILEGVNNQCNYTLANNTLTFSDGYVSIYGRIIYIENQTSIDISPDSNKNGYVVLGVNTLTNQVDLYIKEKSSGYPSLTQVNLNSAEGLYEYVLCKYTKTTSSISIDSSYNRDIVPYFQDLLDGIESKLNEYYIPKRKNFIQVSNAVFQIHNVDLAEFSNSIMYAYINETCIVNFLTDSLFVDSGFSRDISYSYAGSEYTLNVNYIGDVITLSCGSSFHRITSVYLKK